MELMVDVSEEGLRLDRFLHQRFPQYSRVCWTRRIKAGAVGVDEEPRPKPSTLLSAGTPIFIHAEAIADPLLEDVAQAELWDPSWVVFEDAALLVLNKPAGLSVHPGAGQPQGTLMNALLGRDPSSRALPRAGLVHRLDKDTSGLLMVAKEMQAYQTLIADLAIHRIKRVYQGLVEGQPHPWQGRIETQIGRDPQNRLKMAVVEEGKGKKAVTHYRSLASNGHRTHMEFSLETGRTHQIRVHAAYMGCPLLQDPLYGFRSSRSARPASEGGGQLLVATALGFYHPLTRVWQSVHIPLPAYFQTLLNNATSL